MDRPFLIREKMQVIMVDRSRRKDQNLKEQQEHDTLKSKAKLGNPRRWRRAAYEDAEKEKEKKKKEPSRIQKLIDMASGSIAEKLAIVAVEDKRKTVKKKRHPLGYSSSNQ